MIVIMTAFIGAVWGGLLARRRKGRPADIAQYAVGYALAFGIVGLFVTIFLNRML